MKKKFIGLGFICASVGTAFGQTANEKPDVDDSLQEVVVTGTLIRGEAPIGSPVATLDNAAIVATGATNTADILATVSPDQRKEYFRLSSKFMEAKCCEHEVCFIAFLLCLARLSVLRQGTKGCPLSALLLL